MNPVRDLRQRSGLSQEQLARAARTSQPTIAAYEAGRKSPSLRTMERLARAAGRELAVEFVPPLTREDRRSLFLHRAIAARLASAPEEVLSRARRNLAVMRSRHRHAAPLLDEWRRALDWPLDDLTSVMLDPRPHGRDLRQVTPFAGVLSASERTRVYREFQALEQDAR